MSRRREPGMALLEAYLQEQEISKTRNGLIDLKVLWAACGNHRKSNPRAYVEEENREYDAEIEVIDGPGGEMFVDSSVGFGYCLDANDAFAKLVSKGMNDALSSRPGRSMLQCPDNPFMSLAATAAVMSTTGVSAEEAKRIIIEDAIAETDHLHEHVQARAVGSIERDLSRVDLEYVKPKQPQATAADPSVWLNLLEEHTDEVRRRLESSDLEHPIGFIVTYEMFNSSEDMIDLGKFMVSCGPPTPGNSLVSCISLDNWRRVVRKLYPNEYSRLVDQMVEATSERDSWGVVIINSSGVAVTGLAK